MPAEDNRRLPPVPGLFEHDPDLAEASPSVVFRDALAHVQKAVRAFWRSDDEGSLLYLGYANYLAGYMALHTLRSQCPAVPRAPAALLLALQHTALYRRGALPAPRMEALVAAVRELAEKLRGKAQTVEDVRRALDTTESRYNNQAYDLYTYVHSRGGEGLVAQEDGREQRGPVCNCLCRTAMALMVAAQLGLEPVVSRSCTSEEMQTFCRRGAELVRRGNPGVNHLDNSRRPTFRETTRFMHYHPLQSKATAIEDLVLMPLWAVLVDFAADRVSCQGAQGAAAQRHLLACFDAVRAAAQRGTGNQSLWVRCGASLPPAPLHSPHLEGLRLRAA